MKTRKEMLMDALVHHLLHECEDADIEYDPALRTLYLMIVEEIEKEKKDGQETRKA